MNNSDAPIVIEFESTEADYNRAIDAAEARHRGLRWMSVVLMFAPLLVIGLSMRSGFTLREAIFRNMFWLIVVPLFFLWTGLNRRSRARAARDQVGARRVITFDEQCVRFGNGDSQTELPWSQIRRIVETRDSMLLYVSASEATYFPLSAIESADTLERLRQLIRSRIEPKRFESDVH